MGKKIFLQHQAELERGLEQVAHALAVDRESFCPADFFQAFISGFWSPYEEVCEIGNQQQKEVTKEIRALEQQIHQGLPPDKWEAFCRYGDLLAERNSVALDYAFLVGYQCAFRFLLMGLHPASGAFIQNSEAAPESPTQSS